MLRRASYAPSSTLKMAFVKGAVDEEDTLDPQDIPPIKPEVSNSVLDSLDIRVGRIDRADLILDPEHNKVRSNTFSGYSSESLCLGSRQPNPLGCRFQPSRKYLRLVVDLGSEKRVIVSASRGIYGGKPFISQTTHASFLATR